MMEKLKKIVNGAVCILAERIFHKEFDEKRFNSLWQFFQFAVIGLSNTVINYIVYFILICIGVNYLPANIAGFFVSVINAFYWNNKYVFKEESKSRNIWKTFIKTFMSYAGTGLVLNNILLILWIRVLGISEWIAPIISLLITVPTNFILNKFWAFSTKKRSGV